MSLDATSFYISFILNNLSWLIIYSIYMPITMISCSIPIWILRFAPKVCSPFKMLSLNFPVQIKS
ncbi:uncharacterized protein K441DRAFT_40565 [Cenococcum geophilum 1.58]|uniref:uncharacterized protein n=1 Tax=Cenococcum geophilum 1.58 TaxID=794803 RepID=UPI00358EF37F|nr:hypothetical protein K441DRAFT_40565 [Cenococcum geophilum 1.58]